MNRFQLLQQATCAVLGRDATGRDKAIGTAWLAMSPSFLLTAGHVVEGRAPDVRVQFPDADVVTGTVKYGPFRDDAKGVDVAVIQLDEEMSRQPLPMLLTNEPRGDVLVTGYGTDLPNAQSVGVGESLRPHIRNNRTGNFLLQYTSLELSFEGYSGGAVFSMQANAVVGLQIEASTKSHEVLAMPLYRIPQYWQDLTSVAGRSHGICVVLSAADANATLLRDVIEPVLQGLNLDMYLSSLGRTTRQDLEKIERATLVIADGTRTDAAVMRELTVAQGLGTPDVVVSTGEATADQTRLHPSLLRLDLSATDEARRMLTEKLVSTLGVFDAIGELTGANPITNFFGAPLTRVSAANALALGYFKNFVAPVGRLLVESAAGRDIQITVNGHAAKLGVDYRRAVLHTVLPERLEWASDRGIRERLKHDTRLVDVEVASRYLSRPRELKALEARSKSGALILVDIFPTTMSTMIDSINERFAGNAPGGNDPEVWEAIERKEIDRFGRSLARRISEDSFELDDVRLSDVCHVVAAGGLFPDLAP